MTGPQTMFLRGIVVALVSFGASSAVEAQKACRTGSAELNLRRKVIARVVTDARYITTRQKQFYPAVADSAVGPVTDETICVRARDAYNLTLPTPMQTMGRSVYVIRVGNVYSVDDPTVMFGEFGLRMTVDQSFVVLAKFTQ